jgi:uncharacterized membrane protein
LFAFIVAIITLFLLPHMMPSAAEAEAKQKAAEEEKKKAAAEEQKKKLAAKGKASDEQATTGFVTIHWSRLFFLAITTHPAVAITHYSDLQS